MEVVSCRSHGNPTEQITQPARWQRVSVQVADSKHRITFILGCDYAGGSKGIEIALRLPDGSQVKGWPGRGLKNGFITCKVIVLAFGLTLPLPCPV